MVEEKKVLLEKVDILKNVADSLTKSMSTEKFYWCRVKMGIFSLDCRLYNPVDPWMQRKQVGKCWVCVIFFTCVCVGTSDSKTMSEDISSSGRYVVCARFFLGGSQGRPGMAPLITCSVRGSDPNFFGGVFAIFSGFLN
jgi:hypothetical protein